MEYQVYQKNSNARLRERETSKEGIKGYVEREKEKKEHTVSREVMHLKSGKGEIAVGVNRKGEVTLVISSDKEGNFFNSWYPLPLPPLFSLAPLLSPKEIVSLLPLTVAFSSSSAVFLWSFLNFFPDTVPLSSTFFPLPLPVLSVEKMALLP